MNAPFIIGGLCVLGAILFFWSYNRNRRALMKLKYDDAKLAEKSRSATGKLIELRVIAGREKVNLIELAHSVDPDLLDYLSLDDIICWYHQGLSTEMKRRVHIQPGMCSTFDEFWRHAKAGYPLSEMAAEKMYSLQDFWPLEQMQWSGRPDYKDAYYRAYWPKFIEWLKTVQTCEEISRLGCWNLNCDLVTSPQWAPATDRYVQLCRKEMENSNDLQVLWRLRRTKRSCMFGSYNIERELFSKILSLTTDINELKRLAYPKTYEDRVETEEHLAKNHYIKAVESLLLKCRSREDLREFLGQHEIPVETRPLSLRLMAELSEKVDAVT